MRVAHVGGSRGGASCCCRGALVGRPSVCVSSSGRSNTTASVGSGSGRGVAGSVGPLRGSRYGCARLLPPRHASSSSSPEFPNGVDPDDCPPGDDSCAAAWNEEHMGALADRIAALRRTSTVRFLETGIQADVLERKTEELLQGRPELPTVMPEVGPSWLTSSTGHDGSSSHARRSSSSSRSGGGGHPLPRGAGPDASPEPPQPVLSDAEHADAAAALQAWHEDAWAQLASVVDGTAVEGARGGGGDASVDKGRRA